MKFKEWFKNKILLVVLAMIILLMIVSSFFIFRSTDYMKNEQTVKFLSAAIRSMSDSQFEGFDLASRIYTHAFSNNAKINSTFGETADGALDSFLSGELTDDYKKAVVKDLYGGSKVDGAIEGIEGKPSEDLKENKLYVGDILVFRNTDGAKIYIKDKEDFVNLLNATEKTSAKEVLKEVSTSEVFVVLRPMKIMEDYDFIKTSSKTKLNEYQQAIISTAESYLLRGDKLQYADTRLGPGFDSEFRWKAGYNTPEDSTSDEWGYTNCAAFCYDVYFHGLGFDMKYNDKKLYTTANFASFSAEMGMSVYEMDCQTADSYSDADKEKIKKEILDTLEPADILVVRRANGNGHAMIYTGDGNIIHSSGSVYNLNQAKEVYEASIRRMRFNDYFFIEDKGGYIFGSDTGKQVISFYIIRPLKVFTEEIPDQTKNRMANMSGVIAQKTASHNSALTVNLGEEITYNFEVYNTNDKAVKLEIREVVPTNTEYLSGAQKQEGNDLYWNVEIPANTREIFSYKAKVKSDAKIGDLVENSESTVGGIKTVTKNFVIAKTFSKQDTEKLEKQIKSYKQSDKKGFEIVNEIYKKALGFEPFGDIGFEEIFNGAEGVFSGYSGSYYLNTEGKYLDMLAPTLYGGRGYRCGFWSDRTRLARECNLVIGDILVRKTMSEDQVYLYVGNGEFYNLTNGFNEDIVDVKTRLETCLATGNAYAVLRPSFSS